MDKSKAKTDAIGPKTSKISLLLGFLFHLAFMRTKKCTFSRAQNPLNYSGISDFSHLQQSLSLRSPIIVLAF